MAKTTVWQTDAEQLRSSLYLLHIDDLQLLVHTPWNKPVVRARFRRRDVRYSLRVTDLDIEQRYLPMGRGAFPVGECLATVSLAEPYKGVCYKLVAAVILPGA